MRQQHTVQNIADLKPLATLLLPLIQERKKVAFIGEIGAGKTTFIKILCQLLGVEDVTSSPTFAIINEYQSNKENIYHIDLYRLNSEEEAFSIGLMELFEENNYCFVEWPELVEAYFPASTLWIKITSEESGFRVFDIYFE